MNANALVLGGVQGIFNYLYVKENYGVIKDLQGNKQNSNIKDKKWYL